MRKLKNVGQNLTEYALALVLIAGVFLGMKIYMQRGLQARYHDGVQYFFSEIRKQPGRENTPAQYETNYYTDSVISQRTGNPIPGSLDRRNIRELRSGGRPAIIDETIQTSGTQTRYE